MADSILPCSEVSPNVEPAIDAREMRVDIRPYGLDFWEYEGTRAQLDAEGVIPPSTKWPEGVQRLYWSDDRFTWCLVRTRPLGLKGPMSLWASGDWWGLRCSDLHNRSDARRVAEMKRGLADELYRQSPAGQRAWNAAFERRMKAQRDQAFQAFKLLIPGLIAPKRGRKPAQASQP